MVITKEDIERHFKEFFLKTEIDNSDSLIVGWGMKLIEDFNIDEIVLFHHNMNMIESLNRKDHIMRKLKVNDDKKKSSLFNMVVELLSFRHDPYGIINELIYQIEDLTILFKNYVEKDTSPFSLN